MLVMLLRAEYTPFSFQICMFCRIENQQTDPGRDEQAMQEC